MEDNKEVSKWPKFNNIHREIYELNKDNKNVDEFFDIQVTMSIKIDGSNLGIRCTKIKNNWTIQELIGRNSNIWSTKSGTPINKLPKYGNVLLANLPTEMLNFCATLGDYLKVSEIIVFGETVRIGEFSSWHPFGYSLDGLKLLTYDI